MGVISGAGTIYPSGAPEFTPLLVFGINNIIFEFEHQILQ
jgi:hypothetical protein